ncbi:hypothetical protein ES5_06657 [Dietzia cinnamea P4]|nr:hypothetical protein ES5_06657 [Dietzia cinnamea P4]OAH54080.1 anti-sigma factor [Dietzia cinnamea]
MSVRHHDHPSTPDSVRPEDLDLYALDALPEHEADAVEAALVGAAPEERSSMLAHIASTREVMAGLVADAGLDAAPPAHLRERILELAAASSPSDPTGPVGPGGRRGSERDAAGGADVLDLSRERERRRPGPLTFLAVAAAAVVLLVGGVTIGRITDGSGSDDLPTAAPPSGTMPGQVTSLLAAEDLAVVRGQVGGTGTATVLASKSADMAVISMTDLPAPPEGRAYQLWLMGDHEPISAGTMESGEVGPSPSAQIEGIRNSEQIGITEEPAGGSPAPTGQVLLALDIQ